MEDELKIYLDLAFGEVKREFAEIETRTMERLAGRIDMAEERIRNVIRESDRDIETKVISEFWK